MIRIIFPLIVFFISGCGLKMREEAVQKKETEFAQKEQQLLLKEKTLALKEEELLRREKKLDNTLSDTAFVYDAKLIGPWSVKMNCIETTCAGSAVGDTKSETWNFSYQNNRLIAKAMTGEKLVRIYTGGFTGNGIELTEDVKHSPSAPATKLLVRLTLTGDNSMEGRREIVRENECNIAYAIQLSKQ